MKKLGLGGVAAGGVPRAADGEGAGHNLVRLKLAACCLQGWLEKMPATVEATWLARVKPLALVNSVVPVLSRNSGGSSALSTFTTGSSPGRLAS